MSYVLITPTMKIFVGGDSGYDKHFGQIGRLHGPFDLAILENGQYDRKWRYIHIMPDEFLTAANELQAKRILPVHSAKFPLANHAWDEPLKLIAENDALGSLAITPMIGERVNLKDTGQTFKKWWEEVR
jgi:L-ascorbate metabolism protein UlaG (beta-lactamase superfamily)